MHRFLAVPLFLIVLAGGLHAQAAGVADLSNYGVRIEPDPRVIVVLAAVEMAGAKNADGKVERLLKTPLSSEGVSFRERLAADNAALPDDLRTRITSFIAQHKRAHPGASDAEIVTPFISMAYALTPAPELADPVVTSDLPGSLLDVLDFAPLVREFYRKSTIASKLDEYAKEYRQSADRQLRQSTREMVSEMMDYLHTRPQLTFSERKKIETTKTGSKQKITTTEIREHDRHFYVVPELLAPQGTLSFLNIRDDYILVMPPDLDLSGSEGRRAFLRFVIDPLVYQNSKEMSSMSDWAKSTLEDLRKTDSSVSIDAFLAISRSIVAAIDIRQAEYLKIRVATAQARQKITTMKTDEDRRAVSAELDKLKQSVSDEAALRLYEDYKKGAVLSFYFADQLRGVEDSGFDIAASLKEMIASFDPAKEAERVASTAEARKRAAQAREARRSDPQTVVTVENPVTAKLIQIQKTIDERDLAKAQADLKQLLVQYPSEPRIYYNLGRVAGLAAAALPDPDAQAAKLIDAKVAYTNVINTATTQTDPALLSLTYLALGRVYEFFNDNAGAMKLYDRAISIGDVKDGGYREALAAKQLLLKP